MRARSTLRQVRRIALVAVALVAGVVVALYVSPAQAQGVPGVSPNKCLAGKTKCVNKKLAGLLKCREKCQKDPAKCGVAQDACDAKVVAKFDGGGFKLSCFEKLEVKDDGVTPEKVCTTTGDLTDMEEMADACVLGILNALEGTTPLPFVDNGDGTVTDTKTGLMWEKKSDDGTINDKDTTYNWADAAAVHVAALNGGPFAGYTDWRLPTVNELQSIVDYGTSGPAVSAEFNNGCAPGCTVLTCSCTVASVYWSATGVFGNPAEAWDVGFNNGAVSSLSKAIGISVRAVRDAP